ncbi:MAG: twin-arginine translocase TatA/TatE family subunit [Acidobacteriota bacterium]
MSLPDTVFIFVLALIIFGPKKLPEIGRQLGKLVGEFRRASNEFKFQIEEELRQAELADRNTITSAKKELETSAASENSTDGQDSSAQDQPYPEETLPVGQYPNIDTVSPEDLASPGSVEAEAAPNSAPEPVSATEDSPEPPEVQLAAGTEPRTAAPHSVATASISESSAPAELEAPKATSLPNHEPVDPFAAPAVADLTHG